MITINLREMAERRGITTAYGLQKATGSSPSVASSLWAEDFRRIDLTTLDRLCSALRCKPNDLLRYEPDPKSE